MHKIIPKKIAPVIETIQAEGGRPFLVGGAVRDALLGIDVATKDLDFEIYHLSLDNLTALLSRFGRTDIVGRSFGVIKLWMKGVGELDFSLPRRESKTGAGHRGFIVAPDPSMSPEEACARRDFTLNAVLMNPFDGELHDFFGGVDDLRSRVLRHTSDHFTEDPLRPLRAVQLAARFDFSMHEKTAALCASMAEEARFLAKERIFGEWSKWALQGTSPAAGLRVLRQIDWCAVFPETAAVLPDDESALAMGTRVLRSRARAEQEGASVEDLQVLAIASLCLDMPSKAVESFLEKIGTPPKLEKRISLLCEEARRFKTDPPATDEAVLRTAVRMGGESTAMLVRLLGGDFETAQTAAALLSSARRLGVDAHPPKPLLAGRDLARLGIAPGPQMGRLLKAALEAQLRGDIATVEEATAWIRREAEIPQ